MGVGRQAFRGGLCVAVLAVGLLGCGGSETAGGETPGTPQALLVTESEIQDAGADTPTGALLAWWQALQFADAKTAARAYAAGVMDEERIAEQLRVAGPPSLATPEVEEVTIRNGNALVYAVVVSATVTKSDRIDTISRRPVTFRLTRDDGKWLLVDNDFLAQRAAAALAFQDSAK
jgi:hypothetical protein